MKILVVMKRFGANKDMVLLNFGRQIRLFEPLAKKHRIHFLCPDYVKKEAFARKKNGIQYFVVPFGILNFVRFYSSMRNLIKKEKYDVIVAATDPLIGIICNHFSRKSRIKLIYDLQDNYEAYDSYRVPFVKWLDRKAVKEADIVLTVSESLKKYIGRERKKAIAVVQNGIDLGLFKKTDKTIARKKLRLPMEGKIIVYIGHLEKLKGGSILLDAFGKVREKIPDSYLLLSGKIDDELDISGDNIIFREFPKREEVVLGLNASDVGIIASPENNFTKYCFPYKLAEYMACNLPIVATNVGDVGLILKKYEGSVAKPNDAEDLSQKIILKLKDIRSVNYGADLSRLKWKKLAKKIDKHIENMGSFLK